MAGGFGSTPGCDPPHPWTFQQYLDVGAVDRDVANFADRASLKTWAGYPAATPALTPTPSVKDQVGAIEKTFATLTAQLPTLKQSVGL